MEQIIPTYYEDFLDDIIIVIRNYGVCETWKHEFVSTEAAQNGNMIFINPGECMAVAPENGNHRQH